MAIKANPVIVRDGLVLALDAANLRSFDSYENLISHSASTSGIVLGVSGSGGSLPTGWVIDQGQPGTTLEIIGYGVENGLNYIDLKFSGTTTGTNRWLVRPGNSVSLTSGVTYNSSVYAKTISGTPTDVRQFSITGGSGGANLSGINSTLTRYSGSSAAGSTGTFFPRLDIGYNSIGTVMDYTIRVAGFQAEVGSTASTYYPTTSSTKTRGTTLTDLSGFGNTGTLTNGPTYSSSNGGSIVFDGTNDYTSVTNPTTLQNQNFTVSVWVNPGVQNVALVSMIDFDHGANQGWVLQSEDATTNRYYYLAWYDGTQFQPVGGFGTGKGIQVTTSSWQNIVYSKSGTTLIGYLNGSQIYTPTAASNSNVSYSTNRNLRIGDWVLTGRAFKGNISNTQIYNKALTASEIAQNYYATKSRYGL